MERRSGQVQHKLSSVKDNSTQFLSINEEMYVFLNVMFSGAAKVAFEFKVIYVHYFSLH
jgi:hypothetical protein